MRGVKSLNSLIGKAKKGDTEALEALWRQARRFAFAVARRYTPTSYADAEDLQQCAYLGFHTAVMQHTGKYRFLSLVQWCTQRECQRLLDLYGSRRQMQADSLDVVMPDGEHTLEDLIVDESRPKTEEVELACDVRAAVAELPERERELIEARWFGDEVLPLESVGESMGVSGERVRQLEERAFERLRADPILQTYDPRRAPFVYGSGLSAFRNTRSSCVERAALHSIQRDITKKKKGERRDDYACLLESLAADGFISAAELHTLLPSHGG
jgi:RNA polymerase sigma factor (sigma-70 family)